MTAYIDDRIMEMWGRGVGARRIADRLNADLVYDDGKPHWDESTVQNTLAWLLWRTGKYDTMDIAKEIGAKGWRQPEAEVERQIHRPVMHRERLELAQAALRKAERRVGVAPVKAVACKVKDEEGMKL